MTEAVDPHTGQSWIQLSDEEVRIGFLSQCIEAVANAEGRDYVTSHSIHGYILASYQRFP